VVVTLDNPSNELRPGLSATAKITTAQQPDAVSIPIQALTMRKPSDLVKRDDKSKTVKAASFAPTNDTPEQGVFVVSDEHHNGKLRVKFVPVTTGVTGATDIQVLSGVKEGDQIVTGPYKILRTLENNSLVKLDTTGGATTTQ